ncbi:hypothetical protein CWE13_04810 [Aliidiomarina shirensis]|uniref:Uncharacterized protein n=1 Tax=Aliidiomarina shirensis TaxID=1048642 RepID=A0A432WU62_9GAMM|nr:hypothetical protein [Aliidiomarina shirensis]RUO37288.1 hypothetical protein CWE13_04810 [Aliidiomarina shirensis]
MWTKQQRECLAALGIPVYEKMGSVSMSSGTLAISAPEKLGSVSKSSGTLASEIPSEEGAVTAPELNGKDDENVSLPPVFYRLGPWILQFSSDIPAASFDWLRDLSSFVGGRPVQVSHAPADKGVIDCGEYARDALNSEQKQALWAKLKPALN